MCTLSWRRDANGYQVYFNRDEQRSRPKARLPKQFEHLGLKFLMPLDPVGKGSWIAVNEKGLSLYLLNHYQGQVPEGPLISRGKLLRSLAHHTCIAKVSTVLKETALERYAPFTLVVFAHSSSHSSSLTNANSSPNKGPTPRGPLQQALQWDGHKLTVFNPRPMITSSSVKFDEVSQKRQARFGQQLSTNLERQHQDFHKHHDGGKNYSSVCMHRPDAKTVSFSQVWVEGSRVSFQYKDGAPCDEVNSQLNYYSF